MTFKELQDAVKREIEDFSVEFFTDIPSVINEVYVTACDEIDPGVPGLQDIETLGTAVGKAFITQPAESSGKIIEIYNQDINEKLTRVNGDLETLRAQDVTLTSEGNIEFWLPLGDRIWYAPIPKDSVNLEIIFYKNPILLSGDDDIPVQIPDHLHRSLLVHGTAFHLFSRIEQEGENEALETGKQFALFTNGSDKFKTWVSRRQRVKGRTAWDA